MTCDTLSFFEPAIRKSTRISSCGTWRYWLTRHWDGTRPALPFVMYNPSKADTNIDDPTIVRCMGFARREGYGGIIVANRYAGRATKPAAILKLNDPFGPGNANALQDLAKYALNAGVGGVPIVCAWGAIGNYLGGESAIIDQFLRAGVRLCCLGRTANGSPRHPLYVRADQPFKAFP